MAQHNMAGDDIPYALILTPNPSVVNVLNSHYTTDEISKLAIFLFDRYE